MNITEQKAHRWLQFKGYKNITFRARLTPDFIVDGGKSFEVKLARNNTIYIAKTQYNQLDRVKDDLSILVFDAENDSPIATIPFNEIKDRPMFWHNIRIIGQHPHSYIGQVDDSLMQKLTDEAAKFGLGVNGMLNFIVAKYFSEQSTAGKLESTKREPYMGRNK